MGRRDVAGLASEIEQALNQGPIECPLRTAVAEASRFQLGTPSPDTPGRSAKKPTEATNEPLSRTARGGF
jgi:hypothetical protein